MNDILVVVPCGMAKIWKDNPLAGPTRADHAYTGSPFKVNRQFAERFADRWMILSAKYGFIDPGFIIPEPYEVTFKRRKTNPVDTDTLRRQVARMGLDQFPVAVGLGGKEYRQAIEAAFATTSVRLEFPFAGLPIGKAMRAVKRSLESNDPGFPTSESSGRLA
jgi:hypothetical protein